MAAAHTFEPQCGHPMADTVSIQPWSFDLLAGSMFDFCMKKSVALATQPVCPTSEQNGLLVVGFGSQEDSCEAWLLNAIKLWETQSCDKTASSPRSTIPFRVWTRIEGSSLSKVIKKYRSAGSLQPVRKFLLSDDQIETRSDDTLSMVVINRIDRISKNESDQFMTGQYIDLLLTHSSLVLITLPNHPATLDLHPSLASRLSAGFLLHIPNVPSPTREKKKRGYAKRTHTSQCREIDTKNSRLIDVKELDTVNRIIFAVANHFRVTEKDVRDGSQRQCHVRPRGFAIYCVREMTDLSSHEIGKIFGGRDHSTILHSLKVTTKILQQDQGADADLRAIRSRLVHTRNC